jgi:L-alanine-DL-glutamate epimerase-like enolase superfamily enzyme
VHAHLCAAFPGAAFGVESHGDPQRDPLWHGMYLERAQIKDSYVVLNDKPGFGIEIDWKFIARHKA